MKIMMVTPYFFPRIGGLESYVNYACMKIAKLHGWKVVVVTSSDSTEDSIEEMDGIKIYRLSTAFKISNTPVNPRWFISLIKIMNIEQPNVVNAHSPVPFIADICAIISWFRSTPFVLTYHAGSLQKGVFYADLITRLYALTIERIMFSIASKIVVLNPFVKEVTLSRYFKKIVYIPPGITLNSRGSKPKKLIGVPKLLFVGKLEKTHAWKGITTLLESVSILKQKNIDYELHIVGGGDNLNAVKSMSKKLGIREHIVFEGTIPNDQMDKFYRLADLLILPSYSNAESLGLVVLEAMSYGLPIVASNIGGIPHSVKHKTNGILTTPKNQHSVADGIIELISNPTLFQKISSNNLESSKIYSWNNHVTSLTKLFSSINSNFNSTIK